MRIAPTQELSPDLLGRIKTMLETAFEEEFVEDWDHALGGTHFLIEEDGEPIAHTSVVARVLEIAGRLLRTGYVEAVATRPDRQGRGLGSRVIEAASQHIKATYDLGALGTGEFGFYTPFGWEVWRGPTSVRTQSGQIVRTPEEDGYVMILRTPSTPRDLDATAAISCDWRPGDVW